MTKFSIGASNAQAAAAAIACGNLKSDVSQLMSKVSSFGSEDFEGAAASNAQQYAETVIMPLLRGTSALFDDIPIAMKRLPSEYQGRVDHKGWSTEELEEKIKEYEKAAQMAKQAAKSAKKVAESAAKAGGAGAVIVGAAEKCVSGFEKSMVSAKKGANKYKKILKKFNRFNVYSPEIFEEVENLQSNLAKGKSFAKGAYSSKSHKFSVPKESELDWAKYLNDTYAEHDVVVPKKLKAVWHSFWDSSEKKIKAQYNLHGLRNKNINMDKRLFHGKFGMKQGVALTGILGNKKAEAKEDGKAFDFYLKGKTLFDSSVSANASLLKTDANLWGSLNPQDAGISLSGSGSIAEAHGQIHKDLYGIRNQASFDAKYMSASGFAKCKVSNDGSFDIGVQGDATEFEANATASVGPKNEISYKKGNLSKDFSLKASAGGTVGVKGGFEVASQKVQNLKGGYGIYENKLDINLGALLDGEVSIQYPSIRYFNKDKPLKTLMNSLVLPA